MATAHTPSWFKTWLTFVSFYLPADWLATSLSWAGTPLLSVAFRGYSFERFYVTSGGVMVGAIPPFGFPPAHPEFAMLVDVAFQSLPPVLIAALIVILGRRVRPRGGALPLAGFFLAVIGEWNVQRQALMLWFARSGMAARAAAATLFFILLCYGVRWMLAGWGKLNTWQRLASLLAGFVPLPLLRSLPVAFWTSPWLLRMAWPAVAAGALASIFASLWPPGKPHSFQPSPPSSEGNRPEAAAGAFGWRAAAVGAALSLLLFFGGRASGQALERLHRARDQAALAAYPEIPRGAPYAKNFFQKGVSLSAEGPDGYTSARARAMVKFLPSYGVNAVALVPYGFMRRGSARLEYPGGWESDDAIRSMSRVAHGVGLKVMLKPGVFVGGGFAGDLDFPDFRERAAWFVAYRGFLEHYASLAAETHADVFCIGGEFVKLTIYQDQWRRLIARARELYPGPLTYAANFGDEFERIEFWDALDEIGLQEYYPLPDDLSTEEVVRKVEAVQRRFRKPVVFTEVGFPSLAGANRAPWSDDGRDIDLQLQARAAEAVFRAFYAKPWFKGMYWWKIGTNGFGGPRDGSHTPWGKPAMDVIARWYRTDAR